MVEPSNLGTTGLISAIVVAALAAMKLCLNWFFAKDENRDKQSNKQIETVLDTFAKSYEVNQQFLLKQLESFRAEMHRSGDLLQQSVSAKHSVELRLRAVEHEVSLFRAQCLLCNNDKPLIRPQINGKGI